MSESQDKLALIAEKAWFNDLVEDLQKIVLDIKGQSWNLIKLYHSIGGRILEDKETWKNQGYTMREMMRILSEQVHRSDSTLYRCVQFYEFYPDIKTSPYGEDATWFQVTKDLAKLEAKNKGKEEKADIPDEKKEPQKYPMPVITLDYNPGEDNYLINIQEADFSHIDWSKIKEPLLKYLRKLN